MTNNVLQVVNDNTKSDAIKIQELQEILKQLDKSTIVQLNTSTLSQSYQPVLNVLKLESLMVNHPGEHEAIITVIDELNKGSSNGLRNTSENDFKSWFVRFKLSDLQSDYQYLFKELKYDNFIDLINKKMLIINQLQSQGSSQYSKVFENYIKLKILELYLISNYDFRNGNILNYLKNDTGSYRTDEIDKLLHEYDQSPFISHDLFSIIVNYDFQNGYHQLILQNFDKSKLFSNVLENNIIRLSNHFQSIKISTIYQLLNVSNDQIDLESVIFNMIINNKFNEPTTIDQLSQTVEFGRVPRSNQEDHIKFFGNLVNNVYQKI
ncbi:hypothetical protein SBY92_005325 [Candida maltosa Xu316]|uniref:PCI domain-containing protein n=1 Tax=Candida maltosa (strain Xu316) TaxID=1245528 RepID=M3IK42_CANMX|nr:hypothetical protein G210_2970 [Candida maltosa Xu316]